MVYTLDKSKRVKNGKPRKYIHEIRVDFEKCMNGEGRRKPLSPTYPSKPTLNEVQNLCRQLCEAEPTYLNINIISKTQVSFNHLCQFGSSSAQSLIFFVHQVLNLLIKLYEKKYGGQPPDSPKHVASGSAPGAP